MVGRRRDASQYYTWEERQQVLKAMMEAIANHGLLSRSLKIKGMSTSQRASDKRQRSWDG